MIVVLGIDDTRPRSSQLHSGQHRAAVVQRPGDVHDVELLGRHDVRQARYQGGRMPDPAGIVHRHGFGKAGLSRFPVQAARLRRGQGDVIPRSQMLDQGGEIGGVPAAIALVVVGVEDFHGRQAQGARKAGGTCLKVWIPGTLVRLDLP
ncbi:hypothetical protein G6F57_021697 [Rhizopus arrhizus]|nr:hypothetical protein G6F57_021697 [Rhizopus arrhizus]